MTRDNEDDVTPQEAARAKSLSQLVDNLLDGNPAPPALEAHDRELLETATAIFATLGTRSLASEQRARIVDAAFELGHSLEPSEMDNIIALPGTQLGDGDDIASRERKRLPWAVAAVAVAVALIVSIRGASVAPVEHDNKTSTERATGGANSRSADALIGRIARSDSAQASFRMDTIYADRLAGYRTQLLRRGGLK